MARKVTKKVAAETQAAVESVAGLTVNSVVGEIGSLQVEVQKTLADLSAKITGKLSDMDQIDTAIVAKKQQLQDLFGLEQVSVKVNPRNEFEIIGQHPIPIHQELSTRRTVIFPEIFLRPCDQFGNEQHTGSGVEIARTKPLDFDIADGGL